MARSSAGHLQVLTGGPTYGAVPPSIGAAHRVICYFTRLKIFLGLFSRIHCSPSLVDMLTGVNYFTSHL